uniref:C-type lectin domain-containing protein n=1 Tax=Oryzias latipes TaxID=8090 RepID=A0A3B3HUL3_ORYLA
MAPASSSGIVRLALWSSPRWRRGLEWSWVLFIFPPDPLPLGLCILLLGTSLWAITCPRVWSYHFVSQFLNWTEAQTFCRQKYTDLATIENSDEMDQLMNTTLSAEYTPEFWVGLYSEIKWRWSDGFTGSITDNNYNNWASQDSSNALGGQICMIHYHWNDTSCSSLYPFVCNTAETEDGKLC